MENQMIEVRVSKLEGITGKLAQLTNSLQNGQATMTDILSDIGGIIVDEVKEQVKQEVVAQGIQIGAEIKTEVATVKSDVEDIKDKFNNMPSPRASYELIQKLRKKVVGNLLGGTKSPQYILVSSRIFGNLNNKITEHFKVSSYKDIPYSKIDEAKTLISLYCPHPYWIECLWNELLEEYKLGTLSKKRTNAMKEILDGNMTLADLI